MKKINNKGFTLLELIIAMSILTSVMFIGYNIFNKYSVLMHTQSNINKGQLNMNIVNDYLTKDLEQTTSIELKIDGEVVADTKVYAKQKSTDKVLENAKQEIEDRLSKNNNFSYEYKLRLNDESKFSVYKVNIENKNKSMIYTLSLTDKNGVKVDFINNELVKEYEVPFYIIGENPYKVIMGYSDKKNNFKLHQFEVTSRIKQDLVAGNDPTGPSEETGGSNEGTGGSDGEIGGSNGGTGGSNLNGDIVFEYISNDKYNSNMTQLTSYIKTQEKYGEYKSIYDDTNDRDKNQFLRENTIKLMLENNFEMTKIDGKYIKDQTEDTSNLIRVDNSPYGNPVITNNKICKDIRDVNKILITCDDNTTLLQNEVSGDCSIIQKSSKQYELTITKKQPNISLKFTFNQINKIENFKIALTFIEEK